MSGRRFVDQARPAGRSVRWRRARRQLAARWESWGVFVVSLGAFLAVGRTIEAVGWLDAETGYVIGLIIGGVAGWWSPEYRGR